MYGANGEKTAFEMARTGNESGLYGVLKAVAMQVAEDCSKKEISAKAITYWKSLSIDQQFVETLPGAESNDSGVLDNQNGIWYFALLDFFAQFLL